MRLHKIKPQKEVLSLTKVRLIARLKGDGCVFRSGLNKTNYYLKYEAKDFDEVMNFAKDLKRVYGLKPSFYFHRSGKNPSKKLPVALIRSKLAYYDIMKYGPFDSYSWIVPEEILNGCRRNKIEFVKAFADDEGSVIIRNKEVKIYSINYKGLSQILSILNELSIYGKIYGGYGAKRNIFAIVIRGKDNICNFTKFIGFSFKSKKEKLDILLSKIG